MQKDNDYVKKPSDKDIERFIDNMPDIEIEQVYIDRDFIKSQKSPSEVIMENARVIAHMDSNFQNLHSETELAKKLAESAATLYGEIIDLIPSVPEEQASLVIEGLKVMDVMFMRVFGDQLERFRDEDGLNLESKIKCAHYNKTLLTKQKRHIIKKELKSKKSQLSSLVSLLPDRIEHIIQPRPTV